MALIKWIVVLLNYQRRRRSEWVVTTAVLVSLYSLYRQWAERRELKDNCPIVPYHNPLTGSTLEYRQNPQAFVEKYSAAFGPVFRIHIFGRLHTVVSGNYVREVFFNKNFSFADGSNKRFDLRLLTGMPKNDIVVEDVRSVVVKFLTVQMKTFTPRAVHYLNVGLKEALGELTEPKELSNLFSTVQHMVAKASASIFVGLNLCENKQVIEAFKEITTDVGLAFRMDNIWLERFTMINRLRMWYVGKYSSRVRNRKMQLVEAMKPVIEQRLQGLTGKIPNWSKPDDILQEIIENYPPPPHCKADIYTYYTHWMIALIFASVHTTTEHATIVLYRLLEQPEIMAELIEEQKLVYGDNLYCNNDEVFTSDSIKQLVKLDSVCREALRAKNEFLSLPHTNSSNQNIILSNGVVIPPGHDVLVNFWMNHRDTDLQKDTIGNYNKFEPFRYVDMHRPATKIGDDFLVFGEGRHACP
ncbi:cytochrome P450 [Phascolomyces articulosus]|uniref:Cytochrome P450 n=1 Tax=Phascolomyces articulosus TaxID=60185 RepID=A0AAD5JWL0_9FUNG|nr:cytochrome P450 [Phascolomyces articulosus]